MWKAVAKPFMNIEKIHPHQQEAVGKMVELCKHDPNIKRVVIFGSSVRDDCRPDSDIDIYYDCAVKPPPSDCMNPIVSPEQSKKPC